MSEKKIIEDSEQLGLLRERVAKLETSVKFLIWGISIVILLLIEIAFAPLKTLSGIG